MLSGSCIGLYVVRRDRHGPKNAGGHEAGVEVVGPDAECQPDLHSGWVPATPPKRNLSHGRRGVSVSLDMQPKGCLYCLREMDSDRDSVFKALANPSRRRLLDRLRADNGQTLGELCDGLDMTRQAVTKHLALLEKANLVVTIRRGREKLHYLNPAPIIHIHDRWISQYERHRVRALSDLKKALEEVHHE